MKHTQSINEYHIPSYIDEYVKQGKISILEKPDFIPMEIIEIDLESNIIREMLDGEKSEETVSKFADDFSPSDDWVGGWNPQLGPMAVFKNELKGGKIKKRPIGYTHRCRGSEEAELLDIPGIVIEIIDIKNAEEAYAFVTEVRRLVRYLEICDGNMEEGSLRCDANVSVMPKGSSTFGTKVEVKNMNSISNVKRAIEHEIVRQTELIQSGGTIFGETRGFNALEGRTFSMRKKEMVNDYRYFPEPDLPPILITDAHLNSIRNEMPPLPEELFDKFTQSFGLSEYDAGVLIDEKHIALYFEELTKHTKNYKSAANWISVNIKGHLNERAIDISDFKLGANTIAEIIELVDKETVSHSVAAKKLFPYLIDNPETSPIEAANKLGLVQSTDSNLVEEIVAEVLEEYSEKVQAYKSGKKGLLGLFVGECMKRGKGKLNPKMVNQVLNQKLND